jgi:hypothetical protein
MKSRGDPEGLTPEQLARYRELADKTDNDQVETELRELLAHPELWVSSEQILKDVEAVCGKAHGESK